jgi:UDP-glucose 4-epimerase
MTDSRRILITGLSSHWGGRLAQLLEQNQAIETLIGIDTDDPRHELHRTEFVRVGTDDSLLRRIIRGARIDTVIDTRLASDAFVTTPGEARRTNVEGTYSVLSAAGGQGTPVRKVVFKSSADYYGSSAEDPAFFTEDMRRLQPPRTAIEHDVALAELALSEFAQDNPEVTVTVLRCAPAIGADAQSAYLSLLSLPVVPAILGFDPRWQFVHEDDVLGALAYAVGQRLPGAYNVAADGVLALSEVVGLLGKTMLPVLPPWGTVFAAIQLRRLGLRMPVEMLRDLRHGRGLDNRRLKASGYSYRYTTRETVLRLRAHQRLRPLLGAGDETYRYEREVEEFLRWSPSVQTRELPAGEGDATSGTGYDDLTDQELLEVIPSLEPDAAQQLRDHEAAGRARPVVLAALDRLLGLHGSYQG